MVISLSTLLHWLTGFVFSEKKNESIDTDSTNEGVFKFKRLIVSLIILAISFLILNYSKTGGVKLYTWSDQVLFLLIGFWGVSGIITRKFYAYNSMNMYYKIAPIIKSQIFFILFSAVAFFFFRLEWLSRELLFGTILFFAILETLVFSIIFIVRRSKSEIAKEKQVHELQQKLKISTDHKNGNGKTLMDKRLSVLPWFDNKELADFIDQMFIENKCENETSIIMQTLNPKNFYIFPDSQHSLIINVAPLNDLMSIGSMIKMIQKKPRPGGIYFSSYYPLEETYHRLRKKMPKFMFLINYPIHFIFFRILPKLPYINSIYFYLTKGKGRALSTAEVFGRLNYWGFKVESTIKINHKVYFAAKLVNTKSPEKHPSYGPVVQLKRIGLNRELITIYKLRTMHPYSEFIQKEVYENNHLNEQGKLKDDFRITQWGKVLRKLWIDELPQLVNWVRGEVNLVGVRALSEHYFSLYPKDLQDLRTQFKPGLVPPYYADMPKSFDDIIESERKYLLRKKDKPFTTDVIYFYQAFKNIVFKGARSG